MGHLRLAFRTLAKTPFVTTIAVLSLALGIGANAGIFSLFDQILLSSLPVTDPQRLINLSAPGPKPGGMSCGQAGPCEDVFSYPMFRDLERSQTVLTGLAGHVPFAVNLSYRDEALPGQATYVSGSYFPTLGVRPVLGRLLTPEDDPVTGGGAGGAVAGYVTVLSYNYWRTHTGSDPAIVGKTIVVNGQTLMIVGVAARGFNGTTQGVRPLLFVPIGLRSIMTSSRLGGGQEVENRRAYWVYLFGRLKPGVSIAQASAGLNAIYHPIITDVEAPQQQGLSEETLAQFKAKQIVVSSGWRGQSGLQRMAMTPLLMLFSITGIVLLIACANIANLLLARGASRATEMGVRLALGASRRQLLTQLLTESVTLAVLGSIAGLVVAKWTLNGIAALLPTSREPIFDFSLQPAVLVFSAALAVVTGIVFGLFPAWHSTRGDLVTAIRAGTGQIAGAKSAARFRSSLVSAQIALATALLIAAGLFMKSLVNITRVNLGIPVDSLVTFSVAPENSGFDSTHALQLYAQIEEAVAALPGVNGVTTSTVPLLGNSNWGNEVYVQGFPAAPGIDHDASFNEVGSAYFATLGVRLVAGREFVTADHLGAPRVALVNQTFAKKFGLGGEAAVGKFMSNSGPDSLNIQIVGVIPDVKYSTVRENVPPVYYTPWRQDAHVSGLYYYVRSGQPAALLRELPGLLRRLAPALPIQNLKTMPQQVRDNEFLDRMISMLSGTFAMLATLLAAIGLYGVLAYSVAQRTREIGVRMALGADAGTVRVMVLRQVSVLFGIGGVVGVLGALGLGRAAASLLYGMKGDDPLVFALAVLALSVVALGAGYVPARRASEVDPVQALRYE